MKFYVYILARPDGSPFYVGKGQRYRINVHETEARAGHQCHKCNVIRKIWSQGGEVQKRIVFWTDDEASAFSYERELIQQLGREALCNHTEGGEGTSGYTLSEEKRQHLSRIHKERFLKPGERERFSAIFKKRFADPVTKAKRSAAKKEMWTNPDVRASFRSKRLGHEVSQETRAKVGAKLRGRPQSEERKAKQSVAMKAAWARRKAAQQTNTARRPIAPQKPVQRVTEDVQARVDELF